ncbi:MAG: Lrp/AsnC family transcriptional regulator [archaeon]|nr:Lrp/AsnC family transcriptional regulator [archaeon]
MVSDLDKKDIEIIKVLKKNPKMPMDVIGKNLNTSKATISRHVSRMEEEGTIGYQLNIDCEKLEIMKSLVQIQIIGSPVSLVIEQLKKIDEIGTIFKVFGDHNLMCEVFTQNVNELYEMVQSKILKLPSVKNVEVDVIIGRDVLHRDADITVYEKILEEKER